MVMDEFKLGNERSSVPTRSTNDHHPECDSTLVMTSSVSEKRLRIAFVHPDLGIGKCTCASSALCC